MKELKIDDVNINKSRCNWIIEQAKELKALLSYHSEAMIALNKTRALADIDTMKSSLTELEIYIKSIT